MATIRDVAKLAGVSLATVSRVLNASGYADADTKLAVLEAARTLGYQRNVHWSRLASQSSRTVLFLLGNRDGMNSMQMRLLMSAGKTLNAAGYDLVLTTHSYDATDKPATIAMPRILSQPGAVDGVILAGVHHENFLRALKKLHFPYALLANNFQGLSNLLAENSISYDDRAGVLDATQYLLRLGHRRIAFVGNQSLPWFARRLDGFNEAMRVPGAQPLHATGDWKISSLDYGQLAVAELLRSAQRPTAILAGNDEIAAGIWKELVRRQVRIPTEISLIGFGDRAEFSILEPSLTSVRTFEETLGERLATMLLQRFAAGARSLPSESYPCQLIERHSCAAPPPSPAALKRVFARGAI